MWINSIGSFSCQALEFSNFLCPKTRSTSCFVAHVRAVASPCLRPWEKVQPERDAPSLNVQTALEIRKFQSIAIVINSESLYFLFLIFAERNKFSFLFFFFTNDIFSIFLIFRCSWLKDQLREI